MFVEARDKQPRLFPVTSLPFAHRPAPCSPDDDDHRRFDAEEEGGEVSLPHFTLFSLYSR